MLTDAFEDKRFGGRPIEVSGFLIAVIFCVAVSFIFLFSVFATSGSGIVIKIGGRINPNIAEQASLERLPGIGATKAAAIVSYREQFAAEPNKAVFEKAGDLQNVKGIGDKTAEKIRPWLKFE